MPKYEAVLFDLDGTLLNTLEDLTDAVNHTMRAFDCPEHPMEDVRRFVGNGIRKLIERALPEGKNDARMEDALAEFARFYTAHCNVKTKPYAGIPEALAALKQAGVKLAIVSNKNDAAVKELARIYFGDVVDAAVGASDSVPRKPAPEMPLKALAELGVSPENALYVGDSDVDKQTADNAGMECMLVSWGFRDRELLQSMQPDYLIDRADEIVAAIVSSVNPFYAYLNRLKLIRRWGLMRNTVPENDMEHSMQTAVIAHGLAAIGKVRYGRDVNPERVLSLGLYHDVGEVITGDLPTPVKYKNPEIRGAYKALEAMASEQLLDMLPEDMRGEYRTYLLADEHTYEWKLVKAADRICAYLKCVEEQELGNHEFDQAKDTVLRSIMASELPEVQDFMRDFAPCFAMSLDEISRL